MRPLQVTLHSFGAQLALVKGKFIPGFKADDLVVFYFELDAALLTAEAAVGLNEAVWLHARVQPDALGIGQGGAKRIGYRNR